MNRQSKASLLLMVLLIVIGVQLLFSCARALPVTEEYDYVDNNTKDVDGSADKGTHSNFTAQQYGPDGMYDTLTEANTGGNRTLDLYVDAFDNTITGWTRIGVSPYLDTQEYPTDYVRLGIDQRQDIGGFGFRNSEKSSETINSVILRLYAWKENVIDIFQVYLWDGSSWGSAHTITRTSAGWTEFDVTATLNTWAKIDGAKIYLHGDTRPSDSDWLFADCAMLRVDYTVINYELDLEVQWTNAMYGLPYKELCISGGTMGSEDIRVDVWNGSAWHNLFTDLSNGWKNISVTNYLASPTFTIRFKGGTETADASRDRWEIDCTLLHTWAVPPIANFSYTSESPYTGETVTFNASDSYDSDGSVVSYFWDFGDGNTGTGSITTHSYTDNGTYTVTLTVTDNDGFNDTALDTIIVQNRPPIAQFTESAEIVDTGVVIYFNASDSYDPDGYIINYFWDFGDGTNATGVTVSHAYVENGNYTVKLTVTDDDAASAIATDVKTVLNRAPVASFVIIPQQPIAGETIIFNASASYDLDGEIVSYRWDFGDDNITVISSPTIIHRYSSFGNYTVTLTVIDNDDFSSSSTLALTVHNVDVAIADVIVSATEVYVGQTVNISVVVRNEGTANETFNVTLYYDNTAIGTQTVTDLEPGKETTLKFSWDTTDVTPDVSYTIKAEAGVVAGETDTVDNTYTYDAVKVKSQVTSEPFDWSPILPYLIPILLGILGFSVAGILRKKREVGQGFEFFNEMTDGGIPDAYSVMIVGGPGSGKSVLCQQLAYEYFTQGKSCVYVTYDIFPFEVRKNMKNFQWDISPYEQEGTFKFVDAYSSTAGLNSEEEYRVEQPFALSDLGITIFSAMNAMKHKSTRVFLDSTAPLFSRLDPPKVTEFLQDRSARIKGDKGTFFFTVGKGTVPSGPMNRLEEIVDCIIELDVYEKKGKIWKRMRIRKLRGRRVADAWIPFKIELKKGINFFPPKDWSKGRRG